MLVSVKLFVVVCVCWTVVASEDATSKWMNVAQNELNVALNLKVNTNRAKNVVLFLGDGMGISTVSAARLYKAQETGTTEGLATLAFEQFPHVGLSKTYNVDRQTPDSAGTGTAFLCGIKANSGTLGVNSHVHRGSCDIDTGNTVNSILEWSRVEGKSTGVVTTSRVTHATPGASYAHISERDWECDADMVNVTGACKDIARQLIEDNDIDVVLGGGRSKFFSKPEGSRDDGKDLVQIWKQNKPERVYVDTLDGLNNVNLKTTDKLLGLFADSHVDYALDRNHSNNANNQPSIAQMTHKAVQLLKRNKKGFFMLVEGARIDHGHHSNLAQKALYDTWAFDEAIKVVMDHTDEADTLLVVTADHSHVFTMAGYPETDNDLLGIVNPVSDDDHPKDGLPYSSLVYANGPGAIMENKTDFTGLQRRNLSNQDMRDKDFVFPAGVPMNYETHAAEDVGIWARGPMAHLFHRVHEQNYIAHVMAYASCVGSNKNHCVNKPNTEVNSCNGQSRVNISAGLMLIIFINCYYFVISKCNS